MSVPVNKDKFHQLMMGALDGELNDQEQQQFQSMLDNDRSLRKEYQAYKKLKKVTTSMSLKSPPPEVWDRYWLGVYNRLERGVGWIIFSVGAIILLTYFGFQFVDALIQNNQLALIAKIGIFLSIGGLAVLFVSVVREKFFTGKQDPYREIQR